MLPVILAVFALGVASGAAIAAAAVCLAEWRRESRSAAPAQLAAARRSDDWRLDA